MTELQTTLSEQVTTENAGETVLAWLRRGLAGQSWTTCRKILESRRVTVNGIVTVHEGRRTKPGDVVELRATAVRPISADQIVVRHDDADLLVVEKPAGIETTRRPEEAHWPVSKRLLQPTLEDLAALASLQRYQRTIPQRLPTLFRVQRLDRETSGLVVFARTQTAAQKLIPQFAEHTALRLYQAVVIGSPTAQVISRPIVRDRGDGLRGSPADQRGGQPAVTHMRPLESLGDYSRVECRLETGRTHQIRIHLAELGHPVCGDRVYSQNRDGSTVVDASQAPRMALHACQLGFMHPRTGKSWDFHSKWPQDLTAWLDQLRRQTATASVTPRQRGE